MTDEFIQKIGYCEMYEWSDVPTLERHGLFVQFDEEYPDKVKAYKGGIYCGVSTVCSAEVSDDPDQWHGAYQTDASGDFIVVREQLAVGVKAYDQNKELAYIHTMPYEHYVKSPSESYDRDREYTKRSDRAEWTKVSLIGKAIVIDDGKCTPGSWCRPYSGKAKSKFGHAEPADASDSLKFYVIGRYSDNSIIILNR